MRVRKRVFWAVGAVCLLFFALSARAAEIGMTPGTTHDLSADGNDTAIRLEEPGTYRFTGESETTRIFVASGDVTVVFADGVRMDLSAKANAGKEASPITVLDQGGDVTVMTEAGARVYLGGYLNAAIRKAGCKTHLYIDTADPARPGSLWAQGGVNSPGIGNTEIVRTYGTWTGNITFRNGEVRAVAGGSTSSPGLEFGTAGIGGGPACSLRDCFIESGTVKAQGSGYGAGIGGGVEGKARNIVISGGTVQAVTTQAAAAAIGGGEKGNADGIRITGGKVEASGYGCGIGGGYGAGGSVTISGGEIRVIGSGSGIGSSFTNEKVETGTHVTITGGYVTIDAEDHGIGGDNTSAGAGFTPPRSTVTIRGGTVNMTSQAYCAVGCINTDIVIEGGNLLLNGKTVFYSAPSDGKEHALALTTVELYGSADRTEVTAIGVLKNGQVVPAAYGVHDVFTLGDKLYLYLGADENVWSVTTAEGVSYIPYDDQDTGILRGESGMLFRATRIVLDCDAGNGGLTDGSGYICKGRTALDGYVPVTGSSDVHLMYYTLVPGGTVLADPDGTLRPDIPGYTDEEGRWLPAGKGDTVTLRARWSSEKTVLAFDPNPPAGTAAAGTMSSVEAKQGVPLTLPKNAFTVPGMRFTGWTTKLDPRGCRLFADGETFADPLAVFWKDVTLYAQWERERAVLTFDAHPPAGASVSGSMPPLEMHRDAPLVLPLHAYEIPGWVFAGWTADPEGTTERFQDGAAFEDAFAVFPEDTVLYAQWVPEEETAEISFAPNPPAGAAVSGSMPPVTAFRGVPLVLPLHGYEVYGWMFAGWTVDPEGETELLEDGAAFEDAFAAFPVDTVLYAQWLPLSGLTITKQPEDITVREGETAAFSVRAAGYGALSYQWQIDRGQGWENIPGAEDADYTTAVTKLANDGYRYRCLVSDALSAEESDPAVLTVIENSVPVTGDFTHPGLWLGLILLSAFLLAYRKRTAA